MQFSFSWKEPEMNKGELPMQDTVSRNEIDELKRELQNLCKVGKDRAPKVTDAVLALIAAVDYEDEALMDSSAASVMASLAELARDCIAKAIKVSEATKTALREAWKKHIDKKAFEITVIEEIKDEIETIIDERIERLSKLRKWVKSLEEQEEQVENAPSLEEAIRDLRRFREDILKGWPSRKPPAPLDRKAIAQAREAIARGEKGMSKDELIWGNKRSDKAV
jgi:vacuolar-type H+-ATPase subunit I/STV1